jgi:hypothetical protein
MAEPSNEAILSAYLAHKHDQGAAGESALHLPPSGHDPLALIDDIRIDVSINGNRVGARAIHLPTGIAVEAPGLGVALTRALRNCIAAVTEAQQAASDG